MTRIDLSKAPTASAVLISCAATMFGAAVMHGAMLSRGEQTDIFSFSPTPQFSIVSENLNSIEFLSAYLCICSFLVVYSNIFYVNQNVYVPDSGSKPHTMSDQWVKANQEYMKFQKMNPIFGEFLRLLYFL